MGRPGARWLGVIMVDSQGIKSVLASPVSVKQNWEIYGCAKKKTPSPSWVTEREGQRNMN